MRDRGNFWKATILSFLVALLVLHVLRKLGPQFGRYSPNVDFLIADTFAAIGLAAGLAAGLLVTSRTLDSLLLQSWGFGLLPLSMGMRLSIHYLQIADSTGALWSQALSLALSVLCGLEAVYDRTDPAPVEPKSVLPSNSSGSPSSLAKA